MFFTENVIVFYVLTYYTLLMYIYENIDWPNFTFDYSAISELDSLILRKKEYLDGMLSILSNKKETVAEALIAELKASWQIEGINLSDADIYSSIAKRLDIPSPDTNTKVYYDGIADILLDAVQNHEKLTIDRILSWHKKVVENNPGIKRGEFRSSPIYVVSGQFKNREIIYEAPAANHISKIVDGFFDFVNSATYSEPILAAIASYYFVAIHPFEDGNGRISRIIGDYILNKDSNSIPAVYISTEIKKHQKEYYEILKTTSLGSMDITKWITWLLQQLLNAYEEAINKIQKSFKVKEIFIEAERLKLNARQMRLLERVLSDDWQGNITANKYAKINKCHPDTANRDLKKLEQYGFIQKGFGGSKNTNYSFNLNFLEDL